MARAFKLSTIFDVRGNKANKELGRFKKGLVGLERQTGRVGDVFRGVLGAHATMYGIRMLSDGVRTVLGDFIDLDHQVTATGAIFGSAYYRGTEGARELTRATREVGETTEFTAAQAAGGLREYAKAGLDAEQSMGLLAGTAQLATNAEVEFAQAASISLDALDAFNMRSKDTAVTARNLGQVNDTLTRVVTSAKLDFMDFSETLKYAGPIAAQTGAELKDMATITGLVAKAGIRGSIAGTTLKNTYLGLAAPVGKGKRMLKKLNVEISNSDGTMRDTLDVLIDFQKATENMGQAQRLAATNAVFGKRAIAGVSKILSLGTQDLEEYRSKMAETAGTSDEMADQMRNSIQNRLARIKSAAVEAGMKLIDMAGPHIESGIGRLIELLDETNRGENNLLTTIKEGATAVANMAKLLWDNREAIASIAKVLIVTNIAGRIGGVGQSVAGLISLLAGPGGAVAATGATAAGVTTMTGAFASATGAVGVLKMGIMNFQPVLMAAVGSFMAGQEIWEAMIRAQNEAVELENKRVGQTMGAKDMSYEDASKELSSLRAEWKKGAYNRAMTGAGESDLLTGELSSNKSVRMQQEAARAMQRRIKSLTNVGYKNAISQTKSLGVSDQNLPWYNTGRHSTRDTQTREFSRQEIHHTYEFQLPDGVTMTETKQPVKTGSNPRGKMP